MQCDVLIVGAGLAGSILAYKLQQHGVNVVVLDRPSAFLSTSQIAAGIINPVTGKRLTTDTLFPQFYQAAKNFYQQLQVKFHKTIFHPIPQLRIVSTEQQLQLQQRLRHNSFITNENNITDSKILNKNIHTVSIASSDFVDTINLLQLLHTELRLFKQQFHYDNLQSSFTHNAIINYEQYTARRIIFCEGFFAMNNPLFCNLPWQCAKGDILTVTASSELTSTYSYFYNNGSNWLLPRNDGYWKIGATHIWKQLDQMPDIKALQLTDTIGNWFCHNPQLRVVQHHAGVRPATKDRNPFIGQHLSLPNYYIFNGFGAKGSLTIPWYAEKFCDYLLHKIPLPENADIQRFSKL